MCGAESTTLRVRARVVVVRVSVRGIELMMLHVHARIVVTRVSMRGIELMTLHVTACVCVHRRGPSERARHGRLRDSWDDSCDCLRKA